jgi:uncharacterized membrane protein
MPTLLASASDFLSDNYVTLKFIHIVFAAVWAWSTSVAYGNYLVPLFRDWQRSPQDPDRIRRRNWAMERFDEGAKLEHIAFPLLLITGPLLMLAGGWSPDSGWFAMKLVLIVLVFLPIEIADFYLAHFGGNKEKLRLAGDLQAYESAIHLHWWFLIIPTPIVIVSITFTFYLAIVKPF